MNAPAKAPYGTPCNGCGLCCMAEPCPFGRALFGKKSGRCPALEWLAEHGRYACGLVVSPERYAPADRLERFGSRALSEAAAFTVGAGIGCDSQVEGENVGPVRRWFLRRRLRRRHHLRIGAIAAWLGGEKTAAWLASVMKEDQA